MTPSSDTSNTTRRLVLGGIGLLLFGCCFWSGLLGWLFAPFSPYMANFIPAYPGKAELIAHAEWAPGGGRLSPDGRYMVLSWGRNGLRELFIWNLTSDTRIPLHLNMSTMCWLDSEQFAVLDNSRLDYGYFIVRASDGTILPAALVDLSPLTTPAEQANIRAEWQTAEHVFILDTFQFSNYTVITTRQGQAVAYWLELVPNTPSSLQLLNSLLQNIPHTRIPDNCDQPGRDDVGLPIPLPSPDGRLAARVSNAGDEITITDQSGRRVAAIRKAGWSPYLLGWAPDSSGVYVQFMSRGSSAAVTMPWKPIVKLSPLTPQEEAISWLTWLGGGAAVVAGLWWWRRRRVTR